MLDGQKTKLFWCGLFVLVIGSYSLIGTIVPATLTLTFRAWAVPA